MITKIYNKVKAGALFMLLPLTAMLFTACSPEEFEGADINGIPEMSGVDFQVSVDQETNQMIASYTPQPGTYPIWILDGTSYSTLQEVGYKNNEAGTHTIELRLGNRNGMSQTGIKKEYTFNESKIDYTNDFRRITEKEWRLDHKEVAHLACGPAGTAGTGWWSAQPDEKKDFGMYDDRLTFTAENLKGGSFTYNAGEDGFTYVNKGTTKWGAGAPEDWDAVVVEGEQTSSWSFEVYDWTDADGNVSKQTYIQLAPNTAFTYISCDEQYENPRFRIESLTAKKMVLVYEPKDRSIAWRFIFTSDPEEKGFYGFDANSDFNMWKNVEYNMFFWYAPGWNQIADPGFEANGNDYTVFLPEATTDQWQAQMAFKTTNISTTADHNYDFSCILNSDKDLNGVTVKLVWEGHDDVFYFADRIDLKAGQDYIFWKSDMPGIDMDHVSLFFDFGGCQAGTTVNIYNIVLKDHANDDGTVLPVTPDTPTVDWVDVNSPDNLGAGFNTAGTMNFWWADPSWTQIDDPDFSYENGVYTITALNSTVAEWQAQCSITGVPLHIEKGQGYDVRVTIVSNMDGRATVKVNKDPDVTNDPNTLCYKGNFVLEDGENVLEFIGVVAKNGEKEIEFDQGKMIFDFGGCPAGFEAKISNIIIQKHK
jgi:hypothetical protein